MNQVHKIIITRTIKKTSNIVDSLTDSEKKRLQLIIETQKMIEEGYTFSTIAKKLQISIRSVTRYRNGDPYTMCQHKKSERNNILAPLKERIIALISQGIHQMGIYRQLVQEGYFVHKSTLTDYIRKIVLEEGLKIAKYHKCLTINSIDGNQSSVSTITIKQTSIFKYLWMNEKLDNIDIDILNERYPIIPRLNKIIKEFRKIFNKCNMPLLYLFIDKYKESSISEIKSFAKGLERDILAVENAVASELSNGFVEGTNNKIKVIKRAMYGRCGMELLTAKIILGGQIY